MKNKAFISLIAALLIATPIFIYSQNSIYIKGASMTIQKGITISEVGSIDIADNGTLKGALNNSGLINLKGSLTNSTETESLGSGELVISGSADQYIKGNNIVGNLTLNKSYKDLNLTGNLLVIGQIKFIKGLINTSNDNMLTLGALGTVYGASFKDCGANDLSFVNGPMIKNGNTNFMFPVGKISAAYPLHPIALELSGTSIGIYKAEYINSSILSPELKPGSLKYIQQTEYWTLKQLKGVNKAYITLAIRNTNKDIYSSVVLNYGNSSNSGWENAGNTGVSISASNDGYLRSELISKFTMFTYGSLTDAHKNIYEKPSPSNLDIKVYPNPNEGRDINLELKKK